MRDTGQLSANFTDNNRQAHFCRLSNDFIDFIMPLLTRAELVTYLYINRRTTGFQKRYDAISYSQFLKGICTRDGRQLDSGTGLSQKSLVTALNSLVKMGAIFRHPRRSANGACLASIYEINLDGQPAYRPGSTSGDSSQEPPLEPTMPLQQKLEPARPDEPIQGVNLEFSVQDTPVDPEAGRVGVKSRRGVKKSPPPPYKTPRYPGVLFTLPPW